MLSAIEQLLGPDSLLWSPASFTGVLAVAVMLLWMAFAPSTRGKEDGERMASYLDRPVSLDDTDLQEPVINRVIAPALRGVLRLFGRLAPRQSLATTQKLLIQAGEPGKLSPLDFLGLRVLIMALIGGLILVAGLRDQGLLIALRNALLASAVGFILPSYWLRSKVTQRRKLITRALPDALDMLTIGVEAGLAFESALLRVSEKWHNPLTEEFRRTVSEMRVGTSREIALVRLAERCDVPDLNTFVAILVQSSQLGVSIAHVLHNQAAEMRVKRRQRAEELARQATIKMLIPLGLFIFPALFIVILGPAVPQLMDTFGAMR